MAEKYITKSLCEMAAGDLVDVCVILNWKSDAVKETVTGSKMFSGSAMDRTKKDMPVVMFDYSGDIHEMESGLVARIRGQVSTYKDGLQIKASEMRVAQEEEYDLALLVPTADQDAEQAKAEINSYLSTVSNRDLKKIASYLARTMALDFATIPAAVGHHHAFIGGLMMHTLSMMKAADTYASLYPYLDRDYMIVGAFVHDMAKAQEYKFSPVGLATSFAEDGYLFGHLVLGYKNVMEAGPQVGASEEVTKKLAHMVLSHHGKPEYGAAVPPIMPEAIALSYIDNMDAKLEEMSERLSEMKLGEITPRPVLDGYRLYKHRQLPDEEQ
jgi:3'-5' exoribonuclease